MAFILFLIPILFAIFSVLLYQYVGKRQISHFDLVELLYAFVMSPIIFVWLKVVLHVLVTTQLQQHENWVFFIDTVYCVVAFFVYAFIIAHFVTKNFELKKRQDIDFNIFEFSELLHLWVSHVGVYVGIFLLFSLVSLVNAFIPFTFGIPKYIFWIILASTTITGLFVFIGIWLSNFTEKKFMNIMKFNYAVFFSLHVIFYFVFDPSLNSNHLIFWIISSILLTGVVLSLFFEKSIRMMNFANKFHHKKGWAKGDFLLTK